MSGWADLAGSQSQLVGSSAHRFFGLLTVVEAFETSRHLSLATHLSLD